MKLTKEQRDKIADEFLIFAKHINNREINQVGLLTTRIDRIEQILTTAAPPRSAEEILKYTNHLPSCNIVSDWSEAEDAMRCTPTPFRDEQWNMALVELRKKQSICTCGLEDLAQSLLASQFRREVTDAEIMIEGRARNDIMDNGGGYIHYPSFSSGAKWMRQKMNGE